MLIIEIRKGQGAKKMTGGGGGGSTLLNQLDSRSLTAYLTLPAHILNYQQFCNPACFNSKAWGHSIMIMLFFRTVCSVK